MTQSFRVWWVPQIPGKPFVVDVESVEMGRWLENVLAEYDLFQYENRIKPDYCNQGGTLVRDSDGYWVDVDDDDDDWVASAGC